MKKTFKSLTALLLLLFFFIGSSPFRVINYRDTTNYGISTCNDDDIPCEEIITTE